MQFDVTFSDIEGSDAWMFGRRGCESTWRSIRLFPPHELRAYEIRHSVAVTTWYRLLRAALELL